MMNTAIKRCLFAAGVFDISVVYTDLAKKLPIFTSVFGTARFIY